MNLHSIMNASKMHFTQVLRVTPSKRFSTNRHKFLHTTAICYRKSLQEYKTEEQKKIRFYIIRKYLNFLGKYTEILDKRFPAAMSMYRLFKMGVQEFFKDVKEYFKIIRLLYKNDNNFICLTRREIEIYHQLPKDMRKIVPVLLFSTFPFAYYIIFPLFYMYPRQLLTSHFWNIQQKSEFNLIYLKMRLKHNKPVFRCLQEQLDFLKNHDLCEKWACILGMVGSGRQPEVEQILECEELFRYEPYNLYYLRPSHVRHLLRIHDLHIGLFRRSRLADRAIILQEMDRAILREGGVHNLPVEALRNACYIRGLNPANMKTEDMVIWLNQWVKISSKVDQDNSSLLLHAPILLAYNEPTNWLLLYS